MKRVKWLLGVALIMALAVGALVGMQALRDRSKGLVAVSYVYDGDTIAVTGLGEGQVRVRLLGIDAPEIAHAQDKSVAQPYGEAAKAALQARLPLGAQVRLEYDERRYDQYGRTLAYVWEGDQMINVWLCENGWAREKHYKPNVKYRALIEKAQSSAQRQGLGLWAEESA